MSGIFLSLTLMSGIATEEPPTIERIDSLEEDDAGSPEYQAALKMQQESWVEQSLTRIRNFQKHRLAMGIH